MPAAYFEATPVDESCDFCTGRSPITPLPAPLDAAYCISLQEEPHRTRQAAVHFHHIGLCRHVTFYRPVRGTTWESHRQVARHALAKNCRAALILQDDMRFSRPWLEDDVRFSRPWAKVAARIAAGFAALPPDWRGFHLRHIPKQAYFVRPTILRVRSGGCGGYVANHRLLSWLADSVPYSVQIPVRRPSDYDVDDAMFNLPGMYAMFPMVGVKRWQAVGEHRWDPRIDEHGRRRPWWEFQRWEHFFQYRGILVAEAFAVALSPYHWLTLEFFRRRSGQKTVRLARLIRDAGLFDDAYYLQQRPDVAVAGEWYADPLTHYMHYGAAEGSWPCPLFDPRYYADQNPDLGREIRFRNNPLVQFGIFPSEREIRFRINPLVHYITIGTALRRNPHPLFDTAYYLSRYGAEIPQGMHPLAHFLRLGGGAGFDPHPLFSSAWYLARYPQVQERQENPLVHYLAEGWREGAVPHPQFDGDLYLQWNPDVKADGVNPLYHFARYGQAEGRAQPIPHIPPSLTIHPQNAGAL
jgi:hypothetical protein